MDEVAKSQNPSDRRPQQQHGVEQGVAKLNSKDNDIAAQPNARAREDRESPTSQSGFDLVSIAHDAGTELFSACVRKLLVVARRLYKLYARLRERDSCDIN